MNIVTKERSQLTKREELTGEERLPINGYEYITPSQIAKLFGGSEEEITELQNHVTNNKEAIDKLNGDDTTAGSVSQKITKAIEKLDVIDNTSEEVNGVSVTVLETDGKVRKPVVNIKPGDVAANDTKLVTGAAVKQALDTGLAKKANVEHNHYSGQIFFDNTKPNQSDIIKLGIPATVAGVDRLAFLPSDQIVIEQSVDGGNTWIEYPITEKNKASVFKGYDSNGVNLNFPMIDGKKNIKSMLRVTITAMKFNIPEGAAEVDKPNYWTSQYVKSAERYFGGYGVLDVFLSSGGEPITMKLEVRKGNSSSWIHHMTVSNLNGWSGRNLIATENVLFGGSITQADNYWCWRFTFSYGNSILNESNINYATSVLSIKHYSSTIWSGSTVLKTGALYSWDVDKNVAFPGQVSAASFNGPATKIADYNNIGRSIRIGLSGAGLSSSEIKYVACYTEGDKIKDANLAAVKEWLGVKDIDSALSDTSTNPVQNKVIKVSLDNLNENIENIASTANAANNTATTADTNATSALRKITALENKETTIAGQKVKIGGEVTPVQLTKGLKLPTRNVLSLLMSDASSCLSSFNTYLAENNVTISDYFCAPTMIYRDETDLEPYCGMMYNSPESNCLTGIFDTGTDTGDFTDICKIQFYPSNCNFNIGDSGISQVPSITIDVTTRPTTSSPVTVTLTDYQYNQMIDMGIKKYVSFRKVATVNNVGNIVELNFTNKVISIVDSSENYVYQHICYYSGGMHIFEFNLNSGTKVLTAKMIM